MIKDSEIATQTATATVEKLARYVDSIANEQSRFVCRQAKLQKILYTLSESIKKVDVFCVSQILGLLSGTGIFDRLKPITALDAFSEYDKQIYMEFFNACAGLYNTRIFVDERLIETFIDIKFPKAILKEFLQIHAYKTIVPVNAEFSLTDEPRRKLFLELNQYTKLLNAFATIDQALDEVEPLAKDTLDQVLDDVEPLAKDTLDQALDEVEPLAKDTLDQVLDEVEPLAEDTLEETVALSHGPLVTLDLRTISAMLALSLYSLIVARCTHNNNCAVVLKNSFEVVMLANYDCINDDEIAKLFSVLDTEDAQFSLSYAASQFLLLSFLPTLQNILGAQAQDLLEDDNPIIISATMLTAYIILAACAQTYSAVSRFYLTPQPQRPSRRVVRSLVTDDPETNLFNKLPEPIQFSYSKPVGVGAGALNDEVSLTTPISSPARDYALKTPTKNWQAQRLNYGNWRTPEKGRNNSTPDSSNTPTKNWQNYQLNYGDWRTPEKGRNNSTPDSSASLTAESPLITFSSIFGVPQTPPAGEEDPIVRGLFSSPAGSERSDDYYSGPDLWP